MLKKMEEKLSGGKYMQVLSLENELGLMLKHMQFEPNSIFAYGAQLASEYPTEAQMLFASEIGKEADKASNRSDYAYVCKRIEIFNDAGFSQAAVALISEYAHKYSRRRAFVDELKTIRANLSK